MRERKPTASCGRTASRLVPLLYSKSLAHFGPQHWWPGKTREEVILGAVLTQNTAWSNVERAFENLRKEMPLTLEAVATIDVDRLAQLIRPVGYFTVKARRVQSVARWFLHRCPQPQRRVRTASRQETAQKTGKNHQRNHLPIPPRRRFPESGNSVELRSWIGLSGSALESLRNELLTVHGVGPETADSILLYALDAPTFVVDAYTLRIGARHGLFPANAKYTEVKSLFECVLGLDVDLFNEYHAQLVAIGKNYCKTRNPLCDKCPLGARDCFAAGRRFKLI